MNNIVDIPPLILLAAGKSERMGVPKGLLKLPSGDTLLSWQIKNFAESVGNKIILVLGSHVDEYQKNFPWIEYAMSDWASADKAHVRVAYNRDFELGQFSSIQKGFEIFLTLPDPFVFILPIDVPCPVDFHWRAIVNRTKIHTQASIPQFNKKGGHPVLISRNFAHRLIKLDPENPNSRLDYEINKLSAGQCEYVNIEDNSILTNLNNPDDLHRYLTTFNLKLTLD